MRCSQVTSSPAALLPAPVAMEGGDLGGGAQSRATGSSPPPGTASHGGGSLPAPCAARPELPTVGSMSFKSARKNMSGHDADDEGGSQGGSSDDGDEVGSLLGGPECDGESGAMQEWPSFKLRRDQSARRRLSRGSAGTGGGCSAHSTPRETTAAANPGGGGAHSAQHAWSPGKVLLW